MRFDVRLAQPEDPECRGKLKPQDEEIRQLKRDLAIARQERDILKKATAYFAKEVK